MKKKNLYLFQFLYSYVLALEFLSKIYALYVPKRTMMNKILFFIIKQILYPSEKNIYKIEVCAYIFDVGDF